MKLGNNIYLLRTRKGLSQGDLAEALDVSRQSVSKWETGGATPDLDKLLALCDLFGVTLDELVRGEVAETEAPAAPVAEESCNAPPVAETPAAAQPVSGDGSGMKVLLTVILVILGLWLLFSLFMSPSLWPGLLLLLVLGGFGYALWTRSKDEQGDPEAEQKRSTFKTQLLKIILISSVILLPVFGLASSLPEGPVYAKADKESTLTPQDYPGIRFVNCSGQRASVSYAIVNETEDPISYNASEQRIEIKKDGKWYKLKNRTDPVGTYAGLLQPGKGMRLQISCEELYGNLPVGEYRVLLKVYPLSQSSKEQWIAKEFTIEAAFKLS